MRKIMSVAILMAFMSGVKSNMLWAENTIWGGDLQ